METQCMGCMDLYDNVLDACPHCGFNESEYKRIGYHLQPHTTLADTYIVGKAIGYGGFGVTYVGYNAILEKKVAIKEYLPGEFATRNSGDTAVIAFAGEKEQAYYKGLEQSEQEARRLAKLKNKEGIVDIYDCFRENNTVYIVMEYLQGETLKELLNREKRLSVVRATDIVAGVLRALKIVHQEDMIHRDISPENIFLCESGEITLIDFGAARNATTGHSKSLSVIVKQGYAPPEQYYTKGEQGPWTDIYATAATYYKMLTGITPEDAMERSGYDTLVPPSRLGIRIKKSQENALLNALIPEVSKRTSTVNEFLEGICEGRPSVKRVKTRRKKKDLGTMSLRAKLGIAIGIFVVIIGFVIGYQAVRDNLVNDQENLQENQTYVPNVLNMSYEEAEKLLADSGLQIEIVERKFSDDIPSNIVIGQSISAGEVVDMGTVVSITLSNGGTGVFIEDYVGMYKEDVIKSLDELELYGEFNQVESAVAPGIILSQSEAYEDEVQRGTVISFQVSSGMPITEEIETTVPKLVGMTYDEAINLLKDKNLYIIRSAITYSSEIPKGQIISQSPSPDQLISTGSVIEVEVSGGVEMVRIPNVTGSKITDAEKMLNDIGLDTIIDYDTYETGYACTVIGLDAEEGKLIEKGSTVTIYGRRGITFDACIIDPDKEYGNEYKVGDEIEITVQIDVEQKGMLGSWRKEFGFQYNNDLLEYKGIKGDATATFINNHEEYGDCLMISYGWTEECVSDTITLSFVARKEGEDNVGVFFYQTWLNEEKTKSSPHLWSDSYIPYNYTLFQSLDHNIEIEIK